MQHHIFQKCFGVLLFISLFGLSGCGGGKVSSSSNLTHESIDNNTTATSTNDNNHDVVPETPTTMPSDDNAVETDENHTDTTSSQTPIIKPLTINTIKASDIQTKSVQIEWHLNRVATGQVEYGLTTAYGKTTQKETSFNYKIHKQRLKNLIPDTNYHYRVISVDQEGHKVESKDRTFKTKKQTVSTINGKQISDYGVICDGDDESTAIQSAFNDYKNWTNHTLIFPKDKTCVALGLKLGYSMSSPHRGAMKGSTEHSYIIYGNGTTIKAPDGAKKSGESWILSMINVYHLTVQNLILDGNRATRGRPLSYDIIDKGETERGENQRALNSNLYIANSQDILLDKLESMHSIQDGVYIGWIAPEDGYSGLNTDYKKDYTKNIILKDNKMEYAFRNNLTISNCVDCEVNGGSYSFASGVLPKAGIDLECDTRKNYTSLKSGQCLRNIKITDAILKENTGLGLSVAAKRHPTDIIIDHNIFDNDSVKENLSDHHGSAMSVGALSGKSYIKNNTFKNFTGKAYYDGKSKDVTRSLIDFGAAGSGYGGVIFESNHFENISGFKKNNKKLIFIHSYNDGNYKIMDNTFKNIDYDLSNGDWYKDGHEGKPTKTVFSSNTTQQ